MALRRDVQPVILCAALLSFAIAAPAAAATKSTAKTKTKQTEPVPTHDSVREELDAVRKNIEQNAALEKERGKKVTRLLADMRTLDDRLLASARKREELKIEERDLEKTYGQRLDELQDIEKQYGDVRGVLQRRLSSIYKRGRLGSTRVLAHAATSTEPLRMARYLAAISRTDSSVLKRFEALRYQHETALREIAEKKNAIAGKNAALQDEADRYDDARKEKVMVLAGMQEELAAQHTTAEKLKAAEEELQKLLASIPPSPPSIAEDEPVGPEPPPPGTVVTPAQAVAGAEGSDAEPPAAQAATELASLGTPPVVSAKPLGPLERLFHAEKAGAQFADRKGDLEVPVRGPVTSGFETQAEGGGRVHGLTIRGENDQHVLAVARGEVVFSGPFPGLGNTLIINHGSRYHTVYAHLDKIMREVGARVRENEVIATLSTSEPTLHFELRSEGKALDPLDWFRGGKEAFKP